MLSNSLYVHVHASVHSFLHYIHEHIHVLGHLVGHINHKDKDTFKQEENGHKTKSHMMLSDLCVVRDSSAAFYRYG